MGTGTVEHRIAAAVQQAFGWTADQIEIVPLTSLRLAPCRFFLAAHSRLPQAQPPAYAVLPSDELISSGQPQAADRIWGAWAGSASPSSPSAAAWAEMLALFHPEVGPGVVLRDPRQAPAAVARLAAAGERFLPPSTSTPEGDFSVQFYLLRPGTGGLVRVHAAPDRAGRWSVTTSHVA